MTRFRYVARDTHHTRLTGELDVVDRAAAERFLRDVGLEPLSIEDLSGELISAVAADWKSPAVVADVFDQVSQLAHGGLPMAAGLRAAAAESRQPRSAAALQQLAQGLEQGQTLEQALQQHARAVPPHVHGLVLAAARTGRLGHVLDELTQQQLAVRDALVSVWQAVAYPLVVLVLAILLLLVLPVFIVPEFKRMFQEFGLELPTATQLLISASDVALWTVRQLGVWFLVTAALLWVVLRWGIPGLIGRGAARRLLYAAPIVGRLWQWSASAEFAQLLAVLLEAGVPLPEALRLTGDGVRDASFREVCGQMSARSEQAQSLSSLLITARGVPASLLPFVRWGEKSGNLVDALRNAAAMFLERIRLRAVFLCSISPPLVFIVVLLMISFGVVSLFLPLISMIQGLS
jgi:type II secretory pathway component PulF